MTAEELALVISAAMLEASKNLPCDVSGRIAQAVLARLARDREEQDKEARECLVTFLDEKRVIDRAVLSGLKAAVSDHKAPLTIDNAGPGITKRISGNIRGEIRSVLGLGRRERIDPWDREKKGYVCGQCVKRGRITCDHAFDALRAQAAAHEEELKRLKLVIETKGSLHDANLCTHYLENKAQTALVGRLVEALEKSKRLHLVVEDCWYSCPKSGECCNDESKTKCDCGADTYNAGVDALLAEIPNEMSGR